MSSPVRDARAADTGWMAAVLAEAFRTNPFTEWAIPDPLVRLEVLSEFFTITVSERMDLGYAFVTADQASVALWANRTEGPVRGPLPMDAQMRDLLGPWADRFQVIDDTFARLEPRGGHYYLMFLATHPDAQGHGNGRALLDAQHRDLARLGEPTYLEATDPRARALYLRAGYEDMGKPQPVGEDGPLFWPMWRAPAL